MWSDVTQGLKRRTVNAYLNFHRIKIRYFVFGTPWLWLAQVIIWNKYWPWFDVMAFFFAFFLPFIFFSFPLCVGMECELHKCLLCHANAFMHAVWVWPCYSLSIACKIYNFLFFYILAFCYLFWECGFVGREKQLHRNNWIILN